MQQLRRSLKEIGSQYASYIRCIYTSLEARGVTTKDFTAYLLKLPALKVDPADQQQLLAGLRTELGKAESITDIVTLLDENCASFLDYGIFDDIVKEYGIGENQTDKNREKLRYPEHLKAYAEKHKLSELIKIIPELGKPTSDSEEVTLKFEINLSKYRLANLLELKSIVSDILEIQESSLRLLSIKDGCVIITFQIISSVAHFAFRRGKSLTIQQIKGFRDLSAIWIKFRGNVVLLRQEDTGQKYNKYIGFKCLMCFGTALGSRFQKGGPTWGS